MTIGIFTCGTQRTVPGSQPIHDAKKENVSGQSVIVVASADAIGDVVKELNSLGAARILPVNAESPTLIDDVEQAVNSELASNRSKGQPSLSLLRAGRACSVSFPLQILGNKLRPLVEKLGRLSGAPDEYVIGSIFPAVGGIMAGVYELTVRDGFSAPPLNWCNNVGDSSSNKSVAQSIALSPLNDIERRYYAQYREAMAAAKSDPNVDHREVAPPMRTAVYNATLEAAQVICAQQGRGIVNVSDEFSTLASFAVGRYKTGGYSGDFCTSYNGGRMVFDRRSLKEPLELSCWGMSITTCCPPSVLSRLAQETSLLTDNSGFDQRMWYLWPRARPLEVRPEEDDHKALQTLSAMYEKLVTMRQRPGTIALKMDEKARDAFENWRVKVLSKARKESREVDGWVGKLPGTVLRLAGLLSIFDAVLDDREPKNINYDQFKRGVKFADVLTAHRRKVELERGQPSIERLAAELAGWVVEQNAHQIDTFEIRRAVIPGIRSEQTVRAALLELQAAKWLETYVSPRRDEPLPPLVKVRDEVFDLTRQAH